MTTMPLVVQENRVRSPRIRVPEQITPHLQPTTIEFHARHALADYRIGYLSRQLSITIRREVLNGCARFGVSGDGKEVAQLALARVFQRGDFRAGYYRDQTFMLALGMVTPAQILAQLYAHADPAAEPASGGRSMVCHFGTRLIDDAGQWRPQVDSYNSSADVSCTAGQMPRLIGLAYASRLYRELDELQELTDFSQNGAEIAFGTIGNASCAQGLFWESLNAIAALQAPAILSIWDDGYGISVPNEIGFAKGSIAPLLEGFRRSPTDDQGFDIYQVPGWDYAALNRIYKLATHAARQHHIPAIIHVTEMTQPQGHSTSGSHERYKSEERLAWEADHDPLAKMRAWLMDEGMASAEQIEQIEADAQAEVDAARDEAWARAQTSLRTEAHALEEILYDAAQQTTQPEALHQLAHELADAAMPHRKQILQTAHRALQVLQKEAHPAHQTLRAWRHKARKRYQALYSSHQYAQSGGSALAVRPISPVYADPPQTAPGREILRINFDALLTRDPRIFIFGEDVGHLGDVNQGVAHLQQKYGVHRVADTGIHEAAIIGRAIGMALRGLRPIAEIQYLDYILYALMVLSDDLACLHWRTRGGQKAPVIVRTRGHRLEGIWHSGSPMGALIHLLRGMHILVPRNMTQAAGFYNTLLQADDPALVVERLNAYRIHEPLPENPGDFTVPLGVPELLRAGDDLTIVTYGATCAIATDAAERLDALDISVEVMDVQSLLPFDIYHTIVESLKKTSRILFLDEDMPGGASAYMMQQVLEVQGGYRWLDAAPRTITAQPHRPAYGTDGEYFSKPNTETVVEVVYQMMREADPSRYPPIW